MTRIVLAHSVRPGAERPHPGRLRQPASQEIRSPARPAWPFLSRSSSRLFRFSACSSAPAEILSARQDVFSAGSGRPLLGRPVLSVRSPLRRHGPRRDGRRLPDPRLFGRLHGQKTGATRAIFAYLNLFTFAMLILVLASNMVLMFVGWEGVGLCSYLLIGFWFEKHSAADAGQEGLHRQPDRRRRLHPRAFSSSSSRRRERRVPGDQRRRRAGGFSARDWPP